jgi:hypothetical protein
MSAADLMARIEQARSRHQAAGEQLNEANGVAAGIAAAITLERLSCHGYLMIYRAELEQLKVDYVFWKEF